ncbi:MAG: NAD(P)-dependent oxidoreductase [Halobacteriales archaeon]
MTATRVLVDQDLQPLDYLDAQLGDGFELSTVGTTTEPALIEALADMDVVCTTSRLPISAAVLEATDLQVVAKIGTGIDNVDLEAAERLGIPVTYTPGVNALSVAEHTVGLLVGVAHRISATQDVLRAGGWRDEIPFGTMLRDKTVGIVGYGAIGRRVAALLDGFGVELLTHDPYVDDIETQVTQTEMVSFEELLDRADAVTVNAELTEETRGLIGAAELDRLGPNGILINTARGPIVDEAALIDALRGDQLMGAGLDVFADEPLTPDSPLHDCENVITTPHVAAVTEETRKQGIERLAHHIRSLLADESIPERYRARA